MNDLDDYEYNNALLPTLDNTDLAQGACLLPVVCASQRRVDFLP